MAVFPIDRYLAQDYRDTLRSFEAPQNIETTNPIIPVIDIQKGLPRPNSKQDLLFYTDRHTGTGGEVNVQIATVDSQFDYYYIGSSGSQTAAGTALYIGDQTSGVITRTDAATTCLLNYDFPAAGFVSYFLPLPVKLTYGLRIGSAVAAGTGIFVHFYIRERKK